MLVKRSIGLAIVLFWCLMNFLLIKRQLGAPAPVITIHSTEKIIEHIEEWWGVFYRGEKIGYASQTITPKSRGYRLRDQSVVSLNMPEPTQYDFKKAKLNYYVELMEIPNWRTYKPYHLFKKIDDELSRRLSL